MKNLFRVIRIRLTRFFSTDRGKSVATWSRRVLNIGIFIWLMYALTDIGWAEIWNSLPTQPLFYLIFLISFFQLPLFEIWIYRITWQFNSMRSLPVFLKKKIYNKDVLGYSGEVWFYSWARKHLNVPDREILLIIKDNNIISSVASTLVALAVIALLLLAGQIVILEWIMDQSQLWFWAGLGLTLLLIFLMVRFRHYVISMDLKAAYKIFSVQIFRLLMLKVLNVLMYVVVLPDVALNVWFTLLAIEIILTRIPFLPNRDLIFVGISVGLAQGLMVSPSDIAGVMVARTALGKLLNVAAFGLASLTRKWEVVPEDAHDPEALSGISPSDTPGVGDRDDRDSSDPSLSNSTDLPQTEENPSRPDRTVSNP